MIQEFHQWAFTHIMIKFLIIPEENNFPIWPNNINQQSICPFGFFFGFKYLLMTRIGHYLLRIFLGWLCSSNSEVTPYTARTQPPNRIVEPDLYPLSRKYMFPKLDKNKQTNKHKNKNKKQNSVVYFLSLCIHWLSNPFPDLLIM